jgi:hypothetical protein
LTELQWQPSNEMLFYELAGRWGIICLVIWPDFWPCGLVYLKATQSKTSIGKRMRHVTKAQKQALAKANF